MFRIKRNQITEEENFLQIVTNKPFALANISGNEANPNIKGTVYFFKNNTDVIVSAFITGLPVSQEACSRNIFAFHIHAGENCDGTDFENSLGHYNPNNCPHPEHAGDLPPLFANKEGKAILIFQTDRFNLQEIIGKTVIIHSSVDDFTSQPSGNSGTKIACGVITQQTAL